MVTIAQLVRAPDCGSGGWGFDSPRPPHFFIPLNVNVETFSSVPIFFIRKMEEVDHDRENTCSNRWFTLV